MRGAGVVVDPFYYWLVIGVGMALSHGASALTRSRFARYSQIRTRSGLTGAEVARSVLRDHDIRDVRVEPVAGELSDHCDRRARKIRLGDEVYSGSSMAASCVAEYEAGHVEFFSDREQP